MIHRKLVIVLLLFAFFSCNKSNNSISPQLKSITESVYASGIVKSKNQYNVFAKSAGIIKTVFVTEGDSVSIGSPIFEIDNTQISISEKNAGLAAVNASYASNMDKINDAALNLEVARKKLENDSLLFYRQKNLWDKNIGSKVELEQRELAFKNSQLSFVSAQTKLSDVKRQLKLTSDQSQNNYSIGKSLKDDLIIRSNVNGKVYKLNLEQGEAASPQLPVAVVGAANVFVLELNIDENDILKVKPGQQVFIRMDSYKKEVFEGEITSVDPIMNERTRTFIANAIFKTQPLVLYPNLSVEANILISSKDKALTIPRNYLVNDSIVTMADGSKRNVQTGLMDYSIVEITQGLTENDKLILPTQ